MKKIIPRHRYLEKIKPFIGKEVIKVIVGQRRVGKSFMLLQIMDLIKKEFNQPNIIHINKELNKFEHIKTYQNLYDYIKANTKGDKQNFVFIDEIQDIENFEKALRSLLAEGNYDLYCTGSNSKLLSGELATYLSGRYIELKVFPLTYKEFLQFHSLDDNTASLELYYKFGGLPYLRNLPLEDDVVFDYLTNVYQAILFKDIISRFSIRNVDFLWRLVVFLAKHIGMPFSARNIVKFLKSQNINISVSTVLDYINHLQTAFLISRVKRSDLTGKKIFEVGEKYYFTDIGLRNTIAEFSPFELGQIVENLVFNQLDFLGYKVTVGMQGDKEIDFIADRKGERVYIQVALRITDDMTAKREFGNLLKIEDNYPKYVITLDEYTGASYKGIIHLPLRKFLMEFE